MQSSLHCSTQTTLRASVAKLFAMRKSLAAQEGDDVVLRLPEGERGGVVAEMQTILQILLALWQTCLHNDPNAANHPAPAIPGRTKRKREGVQGRFPDAATRAKRSSRARQLLKKADGYSRTTEAARPSSHPAEEKGRTARLQKTGHGAMRQAASDTQQRHRRSIVIEHKAASAKLRMSGARNAGRCPAKCPSDGAKPELLHRGG